jgi:ribonuclease HI
MKFIAYADGACSGNPGDAAIGMYVKQDDNKYEGYEFLGYGTNNIAELTAVYRVLQFVPKSAELEIYTDSSYAIGILTKNWQAKANVSLVNSIKKELDLHTSVKMFHVKGHNGDEGNEIVNKLAQTATKSKLSKPLQTLKFDDNEASG